MIKQYISYFVVLLFFKDVIRITNLVDKDRKVKMTSRNKKNGYYLRDINGYYEESYRYSILYLIALLKLEDRLFLPTLWMINHYIEIMLKNFLWEDIGELTSTYKELKLDVHGNEKLINDEWWGYMIERGDILRETYDEIKRCITYFEFITDKNDDIVISTRYGIKTKNNDTTFNKIEYNYEEFEKNWNSFLKSWTDFMHSCSINTLKNVVLTRKAIEENKLKEKDVNCKQENVDATNIINNVTEELKKEIKKEIKKASDDYNFEEAINLRQVYLSFFKDD